MNLSAPLDRQLTAVNLWLSHHSIALLRISLGLVFLGFGALKFVPGLSPAAELATTTVQALSFGLIPAGLGLVLVAVLETVIGLLLISGRGSRLGVALLGLAMVGILSPLVLFPDRLFAGPANAPTLEGQYVLKDVVLLVAGLVIAAGGGGGRIVTGPDQMAPGDQVPAGPVRPDRRQHSPVRAAA